MWCVDVILQTNSPDCNSSPLLAAVSSCTPSSLYLLCIVLVVGWGPFMCIVSIYKKGLPCPMCFIPNSLSALGNESVISISHTSIFLIFYHHSKTTNVSLYIKVYITFLPRVKTSTAAVVSCATSAVMMRLNRFESVFEYDKSYNCNEPPRA